MKDGKVRIGINNGQYFETPVTFKEGTWQHIDLIYKAGVVTINGNTVKTGAMNGSKNNILSSNNFGNGHCFKGTIRNLVVKNLRQMTVLSKPEAVSCDGVYQSATRVHVDLGPRFVRDSFEMAFDFNCVAGKSPNDNILVLDTSYRSLIVGTKDGKVRIGINNGSQYFETPVTFKEGTWQHIDLVYKAGVVTINGNAIKTGTMNGSGNNILSSNNFSNGHCFKGTIRNLVVKNC